MQLFYSTTSPAARKVMMLLRITKQLASIELVKTNFESEELRKLNPLGKIPALVDADLTLCDSTLICEYLDELYVVAGNDSLYCGKEDYYYDVLAAHALANGLIEAAVNTVMETRRETEQSDYWLSRWKMALETGVKHTNMDMIGSAKKPNIATIAMVSALGYLDFRLDHFQWRNWNPALAEWYGTLENKAWVKETAPQA